MFKKPWFKKHLYLKVYLFTSSKNIHVYYIKPNINTFKLRDNNYIINPDHIFTSGSFKSVIIVDTTAESINPLNFEANFSQEEYNSAINNKIIKDIFDSTDGGKVDLVKMLLIIILIGVAFILFFQFKGSRTPTNPDIEPTFPTELRQ